MSHDQRPLVLYGTAAGLNHGSRQRDRASFRWAAYGTEQNGGVPETSGCLLFGGGNDMIRWKVRISGVPSAVAVLAGLAGSHGEKMTPPQIKKAKEMAREWKPKTR